MIKLLRNKFHRLIDDVALQILWILRSLIKYSPTPLDELIILCARNVIVENFTDKMRNYTESFIKLFVDNLDWVIDRSHLSTILFCKVCRLLSYYVSINTNPQLKQNLLKIAEVIWNKRKIGYFLNSPFSNHKTLDCLTIGRELIRLFQSLFKSTVYIE